MDKDIYFELRTTVRLSRITLRAEEKLDETLVDVSRRISIRVDISLSLSFSLSFLQKESNFLRRVARQSARGTTALFPEQIGKISFTPLGV